MSYQRKDVSELHNYHFRGWSESILDNWHTLGCRQYDSIRLPEGNATMQVSSTNSEDTNITLFIKGYSLTFEPIETTVKTDATDGKNPVTVDTNFFRISEFLVMDDVANKGRIFLSKDGTSLTDGIPDNNLHYFYSIEAWERRGTILNGVVPPESNGFLLMDSMILSVNKELATYGQMRCQMKSTDASQWYTSTRLYFDESTAGNMQWDLRAIPKKENSDSNRGIDIRIQVRRMDGSGNLNASSHLMVQTAVL
jgi:hypothetical protein